MTDFNFWFNNILRNLKQNNIDVPFIIQIGEFKDISNNRKFKDFKIFRILEELEIMQDRAKRYFKKNVY